MSELQAKKLGYSKELDHYRTLKLNQKNQAIIFKSKAELDINRKKIFQRLSIRLNSFFFLSRLFFYNIFFASFVHHPIVQIPTLFIIELSFLIFTLLNFIQMKHLVACHFFVFKLIQSVLILSLVILWFVFFLKNEVNPSLKLQKIGIFVIKMMVFSEQIFLVYGILYSVVMSLCVKTKKPKFLLFRYVRKSSKIGGNKGRKGVKDERSESFRPVFERMSRRRRRGAGLGNFVRKPGVGGGVRKMVYY